MRQMIFRPAREPAETIDKHKGRELVKWSIEPTAMASYCYKMSRKGLSAAVGRSVPGGEGGKLRGCRLDEMNPMACAAGAFARMVKCSLILS